MISRALVAILLMMNLGVAGWWSLHAPASALAGSERAAPDVPRLLLLSERAAERVSPSAATQAQPPIVVDAETSAQTLAVVEPQAPGPVAQAPVDTASAVPDDADAGSVAVVPQASIECFSIGPFQSLADLRRVSAALEPALQSQQMREANGIEARGYRVYLPAFPSRQQALESARALEERGLRDYYIVTAGAGENTVSLGLFRELSNAETRRDEVRGYGYEAVLEPRNEQVTRYWLDIAARTDSGWRERAGTFPGTHVESMACQ